MADKALQKLEDQLNCAICLDIYKDPKLLQCYHVFCRQCLVKLVLRDQQGLLTMNCPTCRQVTPIPANGVTGLQSAFYINQLLEIVEEHKKENAAEGEEGGNTTIAPQKSTTVYCPEHSDKEAELYCETCRRVICLKCAIRGGNHHNHKYEDLNEAFDNCNKDIASLLEPMDQQLAAINEALSNFDARCMEITDQQTTIESDIHTAITQLQEVLEVRKKELICQLNMVTQNKLKYLASQREHIESTKSHLSNFLNFTKETLKTSTKQEVLTKKMTVAKQVNILSNTFQPEMLKPNTIADIVFLTTADTNKECQNYGKVIAVSSPDPSKCYATGKGIEVAVVGEKSTITLHTVNINDQPCTESVTSLECELVSEITGTNIKTIANIENTGQSIYEINYQPTVKGVNLVHIKVEGQHISGSPFKVLAMQPVERLGTSILAISNVKGPEGIAINKRREAVVTEWNRDCISVYKPNGEKVCSFGSYGSSEGQFESPHGVAVNDQGHILVADTWNHRIQKFTADGTFLAGVGCKGSGPLQFNHPRGIAFSSFKNKIYVGDANCCVQILNSDLTFSATFGKKGSGKGQFDGIGHIACDNAGNVYIAESHNHRIQVFTAEGKFVKMFGKHGRRSGELDSPYGIAIDSSGMVYISEISNNRVSVFSSKGRFVTYFGRQGDRQGEFAHPNGVAVDNIGVVYVCDSENNRIQLF